MKEYTIYTCGKMNGLSLEEQMSWRIRLERAIRDVAPEGAELDFIHPPFFFNYEYDSHKTQREIKQWEISVVKNKTDILVVNLEGINDSVGSHFEIAAADSVQNRFLPIIGIGDPNSVHPWILDSLLRIEEDFNSAADYISTYLLL